MTEIRDDLAEIPTLAAALPPEARNRGVASEAFHLNGPTASHAQWDQRVAYGHHYAPDDHLGENHPLWVLGDWDQRITTALLHTRLTKVTVPSAASYIARNLTDLAHLPDFPLDELANQVHSCRLHLEDVLHAGEQIEKGAPCLTCKRPLIRKTLDDGKVTFHCERCHRTLTANEYRLAVHAAHLAHADRLNASDLADRIGVPVSTIRRWANVIRIQKPGEAPVEIPALMKSCGRDGNKLKVYRVAEALRIKEAGGDNRRTEGKSA